MNKLKIHPLGAYSPVRGNKSVKDFVSGSDVSWEGEWGKKRLFSTEWSGKATAAGQILLQSRIKYMK